jgi:hypothetical protein
MELRIVLVGDEDLGDVAIGGEPQPHPRRAEVVRFRKRRHCRDWTVL